MCGVQKRSNFIGFCLWRSCFPSTVCLRFFLPHCVALAPLLESRSDQLCEGLFLGHSVLLMYVSPLMPASHCFDHCHLVMCFKIRKPPALFFFSRLFWLFRVLWDFLWILGYFFILQKKCHWDFLRDCIEFVDHFV